jgi:transposase
VVDPDSLGRTEPNGKGRRYKHGTMTGYTLGRSGNTKIRVITRMAFGFHGPQTLIALAMLTLGGLRPALPGR